MSSRSRLLPSLLVILAIGLTADAQARKGGDDDIGHDAARRLVESGRILSLEVILARISASIPGQLIETKLENDDGRIVYDLKLLRPDGRVQEIEVDATSGKVLKIEDDD